MKGCLNLIRFVKVGCLTGLSLDVQNVVFWSAEEIGSFTLLRFSCFQSLTAFSQSVFVFAEKE